MSFTALKPFSLPRRALLLPSTCLPAPSSGPFGSRLGTVQVCLGVGVQDLGFRVWGLGFGVWGLGCEVLGLTVWVLRLRVCCLGFGVQGSFHQHSKIELFSL